MKCNKYKIMLIKRDKQVLCMKDVVFIQKDSERTKTASESVFNRKYSIVTTRGPTALEENPSLLPKDKSCSLERVERGSSPATWTSFRSCTYFQTGGSFSHIASTSQKSRCFCLYYSVISGHWSFLFLKKLSLNND